MTPHTLSLYAALPRPHGIGIVGAGAIVRAAHLPAYRKAGFPVAAIFDPVQDRAEALAAEFAIPEVSRSLDRLIDNPMVQVIDIATPPRQQPDIAMKAIQRRKHLLCQKPLAESTAIAEKLVAAARDAGVKLAVNVNMRWDPAMRETEWHIERGGLGEFRGAEFVLRYHENWASWPWLVESPRLLFQYDTIHVIDATRWLFGEPSGITAQKRVAGLPGEIAGVIELRFREGQTIRIETDSTVDASQTEARFAICGSRGTIAGSLGIYYDYPLGRRDTWSLKSPEQSYSLCFEERWIPDAFAGTMAELFRSIEEDRSPANSGEDHVKTLRLLDAIYLAADARSPDGENIR